MGILTLIKWLLFDEDYGYYDLDISVKINIFTSLAKKVVNTHIDWTSGAVKTGFNWPLLVKRSF